MEFNLSNIYVPLYGVPVYMTTVTFVQTWVIGWGPLYVASYFSLYSCTLVLYTCTITVRFVIFASILVILSISSCLRLLISSQSVAKGLFNIIPLSNTSWLGVEYNLVRNTLNTDKSVSDGFPAQGPSLLECFFESKLHTRFAMTC